MDPCRSYRQPFGPLETVGTLPWHWWPLHGLHPLRHLAVLHHERVPHLPLQRVLLLEPHQKALAEKVHQPSQLHVRRPQKELPKPVGGPTKKVRPRQPQERLPLLLEGLPTDTREF